jgi:hypothetical protein
MPELPDAFIGPGADANVDADRPIDAYRMTADVPVLDANRDATTECAAVEVTATVETLPVDIIWVVDNSASMEPSIRQVRDGMNAFAARLATSRLDYRLIVLSLRGNGNTMIGGSTLYQLCVPPPVGGPGCADNAPRFHQIDLNIYSTQPLEQILGTLAQSAGYTAAEGPRMGGRGSEPWFDLLRPRATKSFVVVTDDNARLCGGPQGCYSSGSWTNTWSCSVAGATRFDQAEDFETYPGGPSPWGGSRNLGPGILTSAYDLPDTGPLFEGYTFNAIYGYGSDSDPRVACGECGSGSIIASPGPTYSTLVERTGGVRARLCDTATAWGPFFERLATNVVDTSRIDCQVDLPTPPDGMFFTPDRVNVTIETSGAGDITIGRVPNAAACGRSGGWYYDNEMTPTQVILCPTSCERARVEVRTGASLKVGFGCESVPA